MEEKIRRLQNAVKNELDRKRYEHTLGVMYTSAALAMRYGADVEQALTAGLLHDCAKCISVDERLSLCEKYHLEITESERNNTSLIHARLGAYLAARKYQVEDEEILEAIRSHTTGRPAMSLLEKIVYIADYIEPGRPELPNMKRVRRLAFADIDECLYHILADSLVYLEQKKMLIDPKTKETYEYYKKELGK